MVLIEAIPLLFREIGKEMTEGSIGPITHLVLQCGVGGFASAGAAYAFWNCARWTDNKGTVCSNTKIV